MDSNRTDARRTYKLFIGGAFPRSDSGRSYAVVDLKGRVLAYASLASRKDSRDAVRSARSAQPAWSSMTSYERGQALSGIGEALDGKRSQFEQDVSAAEGLSGRRSAAVVDASIDRWVWYAGWADKIAPVLGSVNPVSEPYLSVSVPEPTGVVAVMAPQRSSLLGLVSVVAPVIVSGNACVVVASETRPLPALALAEVLAASDLPGGVVNILTGNPGEIGPCLAASTDVNALDLTGVEDDALATEMEVAAAVNVKRVISPSRRRSEWEDDPGLGRIRAFVETTTLWQPLGV